MRGQERRDTISFSEYLGNGVKVIVEGTNIKLYLNEKEGKSAIDLKLVFNAAFGSHTA